MILVMSIAMKEGCHRLCRKFEGGGEGGASGPNITAIMEGKLKEKLESLGLALLCLALKTGNPIGNWGERK